MSDTEQVDLAAGGEAQGQQSGDGDSSVIKALRDQLKSEAAARRAAESRADEVAAAIRAEVKREQAASKVVSDLGFPGLAGLAAKEIEGDITPEAGAAFLASLGLEAKTPDGSGDGASAPNVGVGQVADLGSRVAAAASGKPEADMEKRLNGASSQAEIAAIMAEAGLLTSQ